MNTVHEYTFLFGLLIVAALLGWQRLIVIDQILGRVARCLARSPALSCATCVLVCAGFTLLNGLWNGIRPPGAHDEFGYLLQADTFCQRRLSNPTPPFWQHFESLHIIVQPTYQAKYPSAQGLALAAGQAAAGHPLVGVWVTCALSAAAVWWMLAGWLPARWAVLGGLLWAMKLAPTYWAQTYWGGALACIGGALLLGGLRRVWDQPRWSCALMMGLGTGLLANTRPYEGLVIVAAVAAALVYRLFKAPWSPGVVVLQLGIPGVVALMPGLFWLAACNQAVTGDWSRMPYQVHDATYSANPTFLYQEALPADKIPEYRHAPLREYFVEWERERWERKSRWYGLNASLFTKLWIFFRFFFGGPFTAPLMALLLAPRRPWIVFAAALVALAIVANSQTLYLFSHYTAAVTSLTLLLGVAGLRHLRHWKPGQRPVGRALAGWTAAGLALAAIYTPLVTNSAPRSQETPRSLVEATLRARGPGTHLIFVKYPHSPNQPEWVYNGADIDACRFIWARAISREQDAALAARYPERWVWKLKIGKQPFGAVLVREPLTSPLGTSPPQEAIPVEQPLFPPPPYERTAARL